ncbi:MAG TPA: ATP-binding cassette domain-containing protein [Candidatus Babeliales bacterium]|nr:ATP-binding cassette domain-containing protein [Candidatus Babeliales bacterium]
MSHYAIEIHDIYKSYGTQQVLKGLSLEVATGSIFALLGPNGAGKTTLLRIVTTLLKPDSGTVLITGLDLNKSARQVKELIGIVGQYASVDQQLTGYENLVMLGRLHHLRPAVAQQSAKKLLAQLQLSSAANRLVGEYSGGMRRRLDLAASLIAHPRVLFLDEPTTGLDPHSREILWDMIRDLAAQGTTILLTTQYLEEADRLADKIAIINHGKIIACDTASHLKAQIGAEYFSVTVANDQALVLAGENLSDLKFYIDSKAKRINFPIASGLAGVEQLQLILARLIAAGIPVQQYDIHRPTLDDVFMNLTRLGDAPESD